MHEYTAFNPSAAAAASSAAGAGAGGHITISVTSNTYVVDDYVENYLV
jgi:hypothetical protein